MLISIPELKQGWSVTLRFWSEEAYLKAYASFGGEWSCTINEENPCACCGSSSGSRMFIGYGDTRDKAVSQAVIQYEAWLKQEAARAATPVQHETKETQ